MQDLPNLGQLYNDSNKPVIEVRYSNDNIIKTFGAVDNDEAEFYEIPQHLVNAVISIEDRKFFNHGGIDYFAILRAFYVNQKNGYIVQGASTITQQLSKLLFLSSNKTIKRKIQEILLSFQLEREFTKEQILTIYLNRAYFGSGNYGVKNAAKSYFNKDIAQINLNEATILASILKAPSRLSPKVNLELVKNRADLVLKNMIKYGYIDESHIGELSDNINYKNDSFQRFYVADLVKRNFKDFLASDLDENKSFFIRTTIDENIQNNLEDILYKFLKSNNKKIDKSQIAVVVMDKNGKLKALIGGKDYQKSQFNRAIDAKRQAGSLFKTFVYLTAFEQGFKSDDFLVDSKVEFSNWLPDNYNDKYYGIVDLKTSFAKSLNSIAIKLAKQSSLDAVIDMLAKFGLKADKKDGLTVALGSSSVSLYELVAAYAVIANDGQAFIPSYVEEIYDESNEELYMRFGSNLGKIISDESWLMIDNLLNEVVLNGTARNAISNKNARGKTGTSQNFRDAWFVGYSGDYVIGVWIGNDDYSATNKISGGGLPAKLFSRILSDINL